MSGVRCAARLAFVALLLALALDLRAETSPQRSGGDPRLRTATYSAEEVYRIRGFVGYEIDLEFEPGESFVGLAAGDIEALTYAAQENHLFLKPRVASVGTNLTILTTQRHYHLYYTAVARAPDPSDPDLMYALRFMYPHAERTATRAEALEIERELQRAPALRPRNLEYWYCGSPALRPVAASDDGVQTRLRFGADSELPAVFVRNDDGSESLLNFSMEADEMVVHRIARRFILRRGALTGCVVNKAFAGSGARLDSGTISPDVTRERRGGAEK